METSRSVANLTTEQLYRKRAFDRENQRASRARKKTRIAELEDEVADLKRRLALSEEEAKRSQSNEATLREVIDSARSSLRIGVGSQHAERQRQFVMPSPPSSTSTLERGSVDEEFGAVGLELRSPAVDFGFHGVVEGELPTTGDFGDEVRLGAEEVTADDVEGLVIGGGSTALTFGVPLSPNFDTMSYFWDHIFSTDLFPSTPFSLSSFDLFPSSFPHTPWPSPNETPSPRHSQLMRQWERVPLHIDPSCRLDTVILELFRSSRQRSEKIPEFTGPVFPSIGSLLNPESGSDYSPISNAIGVHGRVTMAMPSLELKIAIMYNMCVYLRWLITPTKQNYEAMPEYLRPLEVQLTIPHPAWIDVIVWPEARERIIRCMDWTEFEILRAIGNHDMSINWPHGLHTVFSASEPGDMRMNPSFERHIRRLENWTMGGKVAERFPFMEGVSAKPKGGG
ncbi:hypothetical protein K505DRAFT_321314 [Melanomma pulvis-pyrius CBS 109.77]|uniref:BZIP domain-containing protein n=1 Tax=Melanomma pulvis-pyrius CBS 109.77 TaxID=1314802 RepID=A0A6A6XT03_9PLEO|nr:hypothetical protein K505DRAFT_321314 [Melanomma pulvis-pyrius CBS 109.77]